MPLQQMLFYDMVIPRDAFEQTTQPWKELAETYLAAIENGAKKSGVECDVVYERSDSPYEVIIQVVEQKGCDLIMMASHGRRGVKALLIGSETQKVLTHSKIPVLVYR